VITVRVLASLCIIGIAATKSFATDLQPQALTAKTTIDPGPNIFTLDSQPDGASSINVLSARDLHSKGHMSMGELSQMAISTDGKTAFTASIYQKRYTYGDLETLLQVFDVSTLRPTKEIVLPSKLALLVASESMVATSADGKYVYVQNATPATSVTVIDPVAGKVTGELPTPGCFGIYPSLHDYRFSALCGDGTVASFALRSGGGSAERTQSAKIFDPDKDPLFLQSARVAGGELVFLSYNGNLYRLSDEATAVTLLGTRSIVEGTSGGWAPGGHELFGYNKRNDVLFIGMHPNAKDGSHKQAAKEIWAFSVKARKLLFRTPVDDVNSLTVSDDALPVVFALSDKVTRRYEADPDAKFALRKTHESRNTVLFNADVVYRP
jgi:methylamine dehydrogenase heavy chain